MNFIIGKAILQFIKGGCDMAELANCLNCDAVYVKSIRNICQKCYEAEEKAFETVYRFLLPRKNREATMTDIVEATGVEEKLIIKFIREKRLRTSQFPMLAYGCERCGKNITSGNICTDCSQEIRGDLEKFEEEKERNAERKSEEEKRTDVYYTFNKSEFHADE